MIILVVKNTFQRRKRQIRDNVHFYGREVDRDRGVGGLPSPALDFTENCTQMFQYFDFFLPKLGQNKPF